MKSNEHNSLANTARARSLARSHSHTWDARTNCALQVHCGTHVVFCFALHKLPKYDDSSPAHSVAHCFCYYLSNFLFFLRVFAFSRDEIALFSFRFVLWREHDVVRGVYDARTTKFSLTRSRRIYWRRSVFLTLSFWVCCCSCRFQYTHIRCGAQRRRANRYEERNYVRWQTRREKESTRSVLVFFPIRIHSVDVFFFFFDFHLFLSCFSRLLRPESDISVPSLRTIFYIDSVGAHLKFEYALSNDAKQRLTAQWKQAKTYGTRHWLLSNGYTYTHDPHSVATTATRVCVCELCAVRACVLERGYLHL